MTSAASQRCKQDHEAWRKRFGRDGLAMPVLAARTELVDAIVHEAYQRILAPVFVRGAQGDADGARRHGDVGAFTQLVEEGGLEVFGEYGHERMLHGL